MRPETDIRILLVDDQPLFRRALATLIAEQPRLSVVGEAQNGLEAVEMARALGPDPPHFSAGAAASWGS